jgi:carotenoid cleavage dioxygenase-like enzyme
LGAELPAAGNVSQQRLDDRAQEFPRIDERLTSRPHRFGYSAVIGEVSRAGVSGAGDFAAGAFANAHVPRARKVQLARDAGTPQCRWHGGRLGPC